MAMQHSWRLAPAAGGRRPEGRRWAALTLAAALVAGCDDPSGEPAAGGTGSWTTPTGTGGAGGGAAGAGGAHGGGRPDLGWPFDDAVPDPCPPNPPDAGGASWTGWANVQYPEQASVVVGQSSEPFYGRVYRDGETPLPGQATGWEAEIAIGPYGSSPLGEGRCWAYGAAAFNVDVGNDDEYVATTTVATAGLYGVFFRYRPPGGAWLYGDLGGSDDGISALAAALLDVRAASTGSAPLVVATLNLRCRLDDWPTRRDLVVRALSRIDPDLVAVQEDCLASGGPAQIDEIRERLAPYTGRGYDSRREGTHLATGDGQSFEEGIAVLSAHRIEQSHVLELPYANFPRKALAVEVTVRGEALRFYATHFDYGAESADERTESAQAILADIPAGAAAIVAGDLNATAESAAVQALSATLADLWPTANPSDPGLTMPAPSPERRIDYLFATPALSLALRGARLLAEEQNGVWLSDHRGVAAAIELP